MEVYNREVKAWLPTQGPCPVWLSGVLGRVKEVRPRENHHMKGRIGSLLMDKEFWLGVSRRGHRWIHDNPKWAREQGWLK
jgi:hypothetical protein